jgi:hypothetical protein
MNSCTAADGSDNPRMELDQIDAVAQVVKIARRLRKVRRAQRRFLDLWVREQSDTAIGMIARAELRLRCPQNPASRRLDH